MSCCSICRRRRRPALHGQILYTCPRSQEYIPIALKNRHRQSGLFGPPTGKFDPYTHRFLVKTSMTSTEIPKKLVDINLNVVRMKIEGEWAAHNYAPETKVIHKKLCAGRIAGISLMFVVVPIVDFIQK